MRHQSSAKSSTAAAAMAESAAVRASSFWLRDRIAEGSCPRGATRVARRARVRNATTDDRRLSAVRLNDRRRNRHRRHLDEQRERARRRPAVAGRAEPGLNRPRRRSRPGGPHGGRPADKEVLESGRGCRMSVVVGCRRPWLTALHVPGTDPSWVTTFDCGSTRAPTRARRRAEEAESIGQVQTRAEREQLRYDRSSAEPN